MKTDIKCYDILIIGGGPAGSVTALLLSKYGFKVAIVDSNVKVKFGIGECLPPECKPLLDKLVLWNKIKSEGHRPCYGNQSAWEDNILRSNDFIYSPWGHGWHLDRIKFDLMLQNEAKRNNVDIFLDIKITKIQLIDNFWQIYGIRESFIAKFLVDATGKSSWLSYKLGARRQFYDFQVAIAGRFQYRLNYDSDSFTLVEAAKDGWWYSSALPYGYRIVIFFTNSRNAQFIKNRSFFLKEISKTSYISKRIFPNYVLKDGPIIVSANTSILNKIAGRKWLAVGDAAISHDPISSYGLTFALQSSFLAASSIKSTLQNESIALFKYEQTLKQGFTKFLFKLKEVYNRSKFSNSYWKRMNLESATNIGIKQL
jgi:flavin-dependent dehydrogenase